MDDNHKYTVKEYRDALYTHIAQKKKMEHKTLIIRNMNQVQGNISADKSTSPTKKDSYIKKSKDSEPSNTDISEHKNMDFQHPNRMINHNKSQSYTHS